MNTSRFSETQIVAILKQADAGLKVQDLCREYGMSDATDDNWKAMYGGFEASDLKRLKETESELAKLKRLCSFPNIISEIVCFNHAPLFITGGRSACRTAKSGD